MAQTHIDKDAFPDPETDAFLKQLEQRAARITKAGASVIASGIRGERPLNAWKRNGVSITQMPDDYQNILRVSIGGGDETPVALDYCTFRGDLERCNSLLRKVLEQLEILSAQLPKQD